MPELPEVETTKASLNPLLGKVVNKVSVYERRLRWPVPENISRLEGYVLTHVNRRAKYLILTFLKVSNNDLTSETPANYPKTDTAHTQSVIIHLGMSGSLQQFPIGTAKRKHDHLILAFNNSDKSTGDITQLHYHDPRRFGSVLWYEEYSNKLFNHLGPEPLDEEFTGLYLYNRIHKITGNIDTPNPVSNMSKKYKASSTGSIARPIKSLIMDQVFVVGVGNIYATESLFLSGIHPSTPSHYLSLEQLETLVEHIKAILKRAIQQGGSTLRDFTVASGKTGYFQQTLLVYGKYKAPCPTCGTFIDKVSITGRASTYCPNCQPLITCYPNSLD